MAEEIVELRAQFFGRVQGVFFRATARDVAKSLGLVGTVRNADDGTVELFAQGKREKLEQLLKELARQFTLDANCPMEIDFYEPVREFVDFRIVYHK